MAIQMKSSWDEMKQIQEINSQNAYLSNLRKKRKNREKNCSQNDTGGIGKEHLYVYQYRSLESFWAIIKGDCFWATNARFSNDQEEQELGAKKMRELVAGKAEECQRYSDCYIVCFCDEDDKLSQWRGYAPRGVSIGFDFVNVRPFYLKSAKDDTYLRIFNSCYRVVYLGEDSSKEELSNEFDMEAVDDGTIKMMGFIPYIKHNGFYEEEESRLVFSGGKNTDLSEYIHYRMIEDIQVPYLVVSAGSKQEEKEKLCIIRICMEAEKGKKLETELTEHLKRKRKRRVKVLNCVDTASGQTDDTVCFGCTVREAYDPTTVKGKAQCRYGCLQAESFHSDIRNEIYLSDSQNQEEVYKELSAFLQENQEYKDIKVWCDGHLPIRSIRVGSVHNKETVEESIRHYCQRHYWLNHVEVSSSKTPYRSSLL